MIVHKNIIQCTENDVRMTVILYIKLWANVHRIDSECTENDVIFAIKCTKTCYPITYTIFVDVMYN